MKKRALHKDFRMELKRTWTRFASILLIVALGVSFFSGLRATKDDMLETSDSFYDKTNFMDLSVAGSYGMTQADLDALEQLPQIETVEGSYSKEVFVLANDQSLVVKSYSLNDQVNQFYLMEGRRPQNNSECMVDTLFLSNTGYKIGDQIQLTLEKEDLSESLHELKLTIVGSCIDPRYISFFRGNGDIGNGNVNSFIVLAISNYKQEIYQEVYATIKGAKGLSAYSEEYEALVEKGKEAIKLISNERCSARYEEITKEPREELNEGQTQLDAAVNELEVKKEQAFAEFEGPEQELLALKEQIDSLSAQIDEKKEKLAEFSYGQGDIQTVLAPYLQHLEELSATYDLTNSELEGKKDEVTKQFQTAQQELDNLKETIEEGQKKLDEIARPEWYVGDRNWIVSYVSYQTDADRIDAIAKVFPAIFFFVAALVCLTTMTRMVDEQRTQIGILKALGYGKYAIAGKFMKYAFLATILGSFLGVLIGQKVFPYIIIDAYRIMYAGLPYILTNYQPYYGILASALAIVCTMIATYIACMADLRLEPANLMRPTAPKAGKRILLERLPMIWNHMNFTKKSTVRNLFRYKKRLLMTVIGIAGCMGLIIVGFGLKDSIGVIADLQYEELWLQDAQVVFEADMSDTKKQETLTKFLDDNRIQEAEFLYSKSIEATHKELSKSASLYVLEKEAIPRFFVLRDRESRQQYEITNDGVIITEKYANMLDIVVGDVIEINLLKQGTIPVAVTAIAENYLGHYIFMTESLYQQLSSQLPEYNGALLRTVKLSEANEESLLADILSNDDIMSVESTKSLNERIDEMLESLNIVTYVLILSAGLLAFIVLYNLSNININERRRELASLKVLGFYDGEVNSYVMRENILLTIIGIGLGVALGKVLHGFVIQTCEIDAVMFGRVIKPLSYVISGIFTFIFSLLICFFMYFKLKKIDMVESLKSVE